MAVCYAKEIQAAWGDKQHPTTNRSAVNQTVCWVQGSNDYWYRTFLKYDLSGIPYRSVITSAKLRVYDCWHNDNAVNGTVNIARVTAPWEESTLIWNTMPESTGLYLAESVAPPGVGSWSEWDITGLVQEWVDQTHPDYGLMIVNNNEGGYRVDWQFANRGYADRSFATYIEIEYEPEEEYRISRTRMQEIAGEIRRITGTSEALTLADIVAVMRAYVV